MLFFRSLWAVTMLFATMNVVIMIVSSLTEASAARENKKRLNAVIYGVLFSDFEQVLISIPQSIYLVK